MQKKMRKKCENIRGEAVQQRAYLFLGKLISRELAGEVFSGSKKNQQTKKQVKSQVMFFFWINKSESSLY